MYSLPRLPKAGAQRTREAVSGQELRLIEALSCASYVGGGGGHTPSSSGGGRRRFAPTPQQVAGGMALHAFPRERCRVTRDGAIGLHRHRPAAPERFRQARAPSPDEVGIGVERRFPGSRLAALGAWELALVPTAKSHAAQTFDRLRSIPGTSTIQAFGLRSAIHARQRFPRVHAVVPEGRLVPCVQAAAGTRYGTAGATSGHADLTWAFSEAAGLLWRTIRRANRRSRPDEPPWPGPSLSGLGLAMGARRL